MKKENVCEKILTEACDDLRIGITLIFYLQNAAEYMKESGKEKNDNHLCDCYADGADAPST